MSAVRGLLTKIFDLHTDRYKFINSPYLLTCRRFFVFKVLKNSNTGIIFCHSQRQSIFGPEPPFWQNRIRYKVHLNIRNNNPSVHRPNIQEPLPGYHLVFRNMPRQLTLQSPPVYHRLRQAKRRF